MAGAVKDPLTFEQLVEALEVLEANDGVVAHAARSLGIPRESMKYRLEQARCVILGEDKPRQATKTFGYKRHLFIPDTQIRPGVPTDHIEWIAQAIVDYRPDVIVVAGDWWDFASLNGHVEPGSEALEGRRFAADVGAGNVAFAKLCAPMEAEQARKGNKWNPRKVFLCGNHEDRADRIASADPKWMGHVGSNHCNVRDFEWHPFLERIFIDGICYSHYFQNSHSSRPIGGTVDNRLNKIGSSFTQGHEQGRRVGDRITASGRTWYGLVAGSCYLHVEDYRGRQGQRHWRGIVVKNEVKDGEYDIMPLTLGYLCRRYENTPLTDYMRVKYPDGDWRHLE